MRKYHFENSKKKFAMSGTRTRLPDFFIKALTKIAELAFCEFQLFHDFFEFTQPIWTQF